MRRPLILLALTLSCALLAAPAFAQRPLIVGAAEDASRQPQLATAKAKMDLARLAGLSAVRITSLWSPGRTTVSGGELLVLQNAATAAALDGIRLFVSVYPGSGTVAPRTPGARGDFAAYAASIASQLPTVDDVIVGNEPNLNRFWLPQFDRRGRDTAAPEYLVFDVPRQTRFRILLNVTRHECIAPAADRDVERRSRSPGIRQCRAEA